MKISLALALCLVATSGALADMPASQPLAYAPGVTSSWRASSPFAPAGPSAASGNEQRKHPAVARIVAPGDGSMSFGSGTLIYAADQYGLVITNWHVINEATGQISVHFPDGFYSPATIQKIDRDWDLAILAIRRPENVEPVPLASEAPRPGESLTIAGYGKGEYRAATGPCTQYVAPGLDISVRDGGSRRFGAAGRLGRPHLQQPRRTGRRAVWRGQRPHEWQLLRTRAVVSDQRRARRFGNAPQIASAPKPLAPVAPRPIVSSTAIASRPVPSEPAQLASVETPQRTSSASAGLQLPPRVSQAQNVTRAAEPAEPSLVLASTRSEASDRQTHVIGWADLAGETLGQQLKTVLAAIGVLAIVLHFLKWMSTEVEPA